MFRLDGAARHPLFDVRADAEGRIHETLDWTPRHQDLAAMVASALAWERRLRKNSGKD